MLEWSEPPLATVPTRLSPAARPIVAPRTAAILATASELPPGRLTSAEPAERLSDYATRAGAAALARAGVRAEEVTR